MDIIQYALFYIFIRNEEDNVWLVIYIGITYMLDYKNNMKAPIKYKTRITPQSLGFPSKVGDMIIEPVTWDNFSGKAPQATWFLAYTYWTNNYKVHSLMKNNTVTRLWVTFATSISPKSWRSRPDGEDPDLLQHQYGHYLVNCVMGLDFRLEANTFGLTCKNMEDFRTYCDKLFQGKRKQYAQNQKKYDKDSYHYLDREGQVKWEKWMKDQVLQYVKKEKQFEIKLKTAVSENNRLAENTKKKGNLPKVNNTNNAQSKNRDFSLRKVENNNSSVNAAKNARTGSIQKNSRRQKRPLNVAKMMGDLYAKQEGP